MKTISLPLEEYNKLLCDVEYALEVKKKFLDENKQGMVCFGNSLNKDFIVAFTKDQAINKLIESNSILHKKIMEFENMSVWKFIKYKLYI